MIADRISTGKVIGIDWSPLAIRFCKSRLRRFINQGKLELICQNAIQIPLPDDSIDCICTVNTVYFWDRPEAVLAECSRVLQSGGRVVLCNAVLSEQSSDDYPPEYFTSHSVEEVIHSLQALGFAQPAIDYDQDDHADFYTLYAKLEA
jgi:ubiquinone/menaquinone biosynthesis C-methylase UbiE